MITLNDTTYKEVAKDDVKDRLEVEIGDSKASEIFFPQVKIMRWDNEVNVSFRLIDDETPQVTKVGNKIECRATKKDIDFYNITPSDDHPEGAFEFDITLKEKPASNVIEFTLQDKDVDYFYQPVLTPEEIAEGSQRPENVVGSYAIYAKTPKTNWTGGKEYKTGKIGHIYRPKIIDTAGTEVWGELHIENGILSVTIPQEFLNEAVYPVRHAAGLTFGYHSSGASDHLVASATSDTSRRLGSGDTLGESGNITSVTAYLDSSSGTQSVDFIAYINDLDSGGANNHAQEVVCTERLNLSISTSVSEKTFNAASELLTPDVYLLNIVGNGEDCAATIYCKYDTVAASVKYYYDTKAGAGSYAAAKEDPWTTSSGTARRFSIYATYTAGSSPSASPSEGTPSEGTPSSSPSEGTPSEGTPSEGTPSSTPSEGTPSSSPSGDLTKNYTREEIGPLPSTDADLATEFSEQEKEDVATDDGTRVDQAYGTSYTNGVFLFKDQNDNSTDSITVSWNGQSSYAPSSSPIFLDIYNQDSSTWENIDQDGSVGADTDLTLTGEITADLSNYYAAGNWVSWRVHQAREEPATIRTDQWSITFGSHSPSASPSEGTPSGSPSEGTPSSSPSASPSEGTPSEGTPSEGTPSSSPSEGTPSEGTPSEGTPSSSPSEGTPSEGTPSEGTPSSSPSEGTPSEGTPSEGTPSEGTPSEGTPSEGTPSSSPSEGTPSSSPSEGTPSSSPSEGTPSSSPSEGTPSEGTPSEGTPSATPSEGTPSEGTPSEGTPSGSPSEGTPSEGTPSEGTPSSSPSEGTPSEGTPSEGTPSATPSEGTPSSSPSEGTPSGTPSEGTPSSSPSEGTPSEGTPSEGTPSSSPSEGTPSEGTPSEGTPSEGTPSEGTPSEGTPSGSPSEGTPSEGTPSEGTPSSSPSEGTPSEGTPSEGTPSEGTPSEGTPSEGTPSEGTPSGSPSEGTPSGSPSEGTPSATPSEGTPSSSPSEGTPSGSPSEGTPSPGDTLYYSLNRNIFLII